MDKKKTNREKRSNADGSVTDTPKFIWGVHVWGRLYLPSVLSYPTWDTPTRTNTHQKEGKRKKKTFYLFFTPRFPATAVQHEPWIQAKQHLWRQIIQMSNLAVGLWKSSAGSAVVGNGDRHVRITCVMIIKLKEGVHLLDSSAKNQKDKGRIKAILKKKKKWRITPRG